MTILRKLGVALLAASFGACGLDEKPTAPSITPSQPPPTITQPPIIREVRVLEPETGYIRRRFNVRVERINVEDVLYVTIDKDFSPCDNVGEPGYTALVMEGSEYEISLDPYPFPRGTRFGLCVLSRTYSPRIAVYVPGLEVQ